MTKSSFLYLLFLCFVAFIISPNNRWYSIFAVGLVGIFLFLTFRFFRKKSFTLESISSELVAGIVVSGTILRIYADHMYLRFLILVLLGSVLPFGGTSWTPAEIIRRPQFLFYMIGFILLLFLAVKFGFLRI